MTTITINERTAKGKMLLSMIERFKGQPFVSFADDTTKSQTYKEVKEALTDVKKGKVKLVKTISE